MATKKIIEMLEKQELVNQMVRKQQMPRHEVVESLLQKQHDAALLSAIQGQTAQELGKLLDQLPLEYAKILWDKMPTDKENDVLWEISNNRRTELVDAREPDFSDSKIAIFKLTEGRLTQVPITNKKDLDSITPIWVDLLCATQAERAFIGAHFAVNLPDLLGVTDLEVSARFHIEEDDDIHLHSNFLHEMDGKTHSVPVAFILHNGILFSLRNEDLPVFKLQKKLARAQPGYVTDSIDVLLDLYGADVEYSADSLENIYTTLGKVGYLVLSERVSDDQAASTLAKIADEEDQNGRIRSNILDTQRALNFLMRSRLLTSGQNADAKQILHNIDSLNTHTAFLFDKINFLMDATIGFININQNKRINQLTVFSVVFMPINILAGMGGMSEFSMMTKEFAWPIAYGAFAIGAALIGLATYIGLRYLEQRKIKRPNTNNL